MAEMREGQPSLKSPKPIKRTVLRLLVLAMLVLLGPYLYSRALATSNRLLLRSRDDDHLLPESSDKDTLRIACYNIAHGRGLAESNWLGGDANARLQRLDQIATLLQKLDADVVVLNEVDFDASWSNQVNQAEYLAQRCGYAYWAEERNLDFRVVHRTWRFGNAILSRFPLSNAQLLDLPSYGELETVLAGKKRAFGVDLDLGNHDVHLVAAHLSHRSEDLRERSARMIVEHVEKKGLPTVIAGDMNSSPISFGGKTTSDGRNAIETFLADDRLTPSQSEKPESAAKFTFRADKPRIVIDWFFASEGLSIDQYRVIDSELSDHRPIVAELRLSGIERSQGTD